MKLKMIFICNVALLANLANGAPSSVAADAPPSNLVLSVSLSNTMFRADVRDIEITVTYSNRSDTAVVIDEGSLQAEFSDKEQGEMFMQSIRASCTWSKDYQP